VQVRLGPTENLKGCKTKCEGLALSTQLTSGDGMSHHEKGIDNYRHTK